MIYVDSSFLLAHLLAEDHEPPAGFWQETLITSRLAEYEIWSRIHARALAKSHGERAQELFNRIALLELTPDVLSRALEAFPVSVRTLDALHLASIEYLRARGYRPLRLATLDKRLSRAAEALDIGLYPS
jgi:predicted nucleic acid-binding protein